MLQFYYSPVSLNARRVWVTLLEKQIPFEPKKLSLDGDQFAPEFTRINPLQRVPVIVDNGLRIVESLAILDYLEAQYPNPSLMPEDAAQIAFVRMVEMTALNELQPAIIPLMKQMVGFEIDPTFIEAAQGRIMTVLTLYKDFLADKPYFVGEQLTLADIVAETLVPSIFMFNLSLDPYPQLKSWIGRLQQRPSMQSTTPSNAQIEAAIPHIREILARR